MASLRRRRALTARLSIIPVAPVVVLQLIIFYLRVVAGRDDHDEHEQYENDHDVHASLICHLDFSRRASAVNAATGLTLCMRLAHIEVSLHAIRADAAASGAVAEGAARILGTAVAIFSACAYAEADGGADVTGAAAR